MSVQISARRRQATPGSDQAIADLACHSSEEILGHPRFVTARTDFVDAVLALYEGDAFLNRLLMEAGRTVIFTVIMCLNACHEEANRATWPTMGLLKQQMTQFGLSSPRRVVWWPG